ncbi:hypothetical protein DN752_05790 [Echinicola strongylocentroti]|uniref:Cytochrome c domain-containing protein n=1 Tax=Echinicola strongylocentroti TaxID=1795355 RepID=A0A2Z4IF01_9BACT|nr:hypothetical protein [Echinicola strongylocentroti]AWW29671.1 hypothetical protein DN752_05790 [Echinicola strongylocentroti]
MKKYFRNIATNKLLLIANLAFVGLLVFSRYSFKTDLNDKETEMGPQELKSIEAFEDVYKVLMSPRCMNCHPAGDIPLQGDEQKLHAMSPMRGVDGKGILTLKCSNCHAPEGVPGEHTPPGNPNWHLPPADMKMVFEGKSPRELALQLVDPEQNGHKDMEALKEHVNDGLVKEGWTIGGARELPPLSYNEFKEAWLTWIENGAAAPPQ